MIKLFVLSLLAVSSLLAETTKATITEVVRFPITVSYSSGSESIDIESSIQKTKVRGIRESVEADFSNLGSATISETDTIRLKNKYCTNEHLASDFVIGSDASRTERLKMQVLQANNTIGTTKVIRMRLDYWIPYMGNPVSTFILCD